MDEMFTSEQLEFFRSAVQKVADNKNELRIPTARLGEVLENIGHQIDYWDLQLYAENLDPTHLGTISFSDFLAELRRQMHCDFGLEDTLRACDPLGRGWITVTELKRVLSSEHFTEVEIEEIARDVRKGERVDVEELLRGLRDNTG